MIDLGYSEKLARKAYEKFGNVDQAANWLFEQKEDKDEDYSDSWMGIGNQPNYQPKRMKTEESQPNNNSEEKESDDPKF